VGDVSVTVAAWETVDEAVLQPGHGVGDPAHDKTGGLVWSAGRTLARFVASPLLRGWLEGRLRGGVVVELGAGPGTPLAL
jgi:hypothetical protein